MKKAAGILGIVLSVVFLILAFNTQIPPTYIWSSGVNGMVSYVGGDAYNFIIEAALRGGEIAGAQAAKAIYFSVAAILGLLGCALLADSRTLRNHQPSRPMGDLQPEAAKKQDAGTEGETDEA